ncbi:methyltransferase-domain-containing protein [Trametes elegans]|nr:methyltransferase-domain-containing protein [Trametes elegans]
MSLFEVPGWSVPPAPVAAQPGKKRKRPPAAKDAAEDVDEAQRIREAQRNIEKLMKSLGAGADADGAHAERPSKKTRGGEGQEKPRRKGKEREEKGDGKGKGEEKGDGKGKGAEREGGRKPARGAQDGAAAAGGETGRAKKQQGGQSPKADAAEHARERAGPSPSKAQKKQERRDKQRQRQKQEQKQKQKEADSADSAEPDVEAAATRDNAAPPERKKAEQPPSKKSVDTPTDASVLSGLTALQANMKKSLGGARFRWINEMLYKSDSAKAQERMSSDPALFTDYHTGFRHQVESWPTNPASHYISTLSSYPAKTVIADLGCGDAALARALVPNGFTVLSFDLVSDGAYVVAADTCSRVPLPGSEGVAGASADHEEEGEGQVVDVVVCALSLMGTNWPGCIREAWRILKAGGEFRIAEVASRFSSVEEFVSLVSSFGFKLQSKDERNSHFTLFEFKKVPRKPKNEKEWKKLLSRGNVLKPCEYKRR